jgi:spore maturation protein CgeB
VGVQLSMNFIINKSVFQYGVVDLFIDEIKHELELKNHNVFEVDVGPNGTIEPILEIFSAYSIDCVIAFGGVGYGIRYQNESIYDLANTNFLAIFIDHPAHMIERIIYPIKNYLVTFIDKAHMDYVSEILPQSHKLNSFLPHAGFENKECSIKNFKDYQDQKDIDILFSGTYFGEPVKSWQNFTNNSFVKLFDDISSLLIHNEYISVNEAFDLVFKKENIKLSPISKAQMSIQIASIISYVRSYKRHFVLEKIFKSGINITVCGNGWREITKDYDNVNYIGSIDINDSIKLISKAKVTINCNPNFTKGSHERVFTAMLNHSVVFTDRSSYYDDFYMDKDDILYYSIDTIDKDILKLKNYLKSSSKLFDMSCKAYSITHKNHLWKYRAEKIEDMVYLSKIIDK